MLLLFALGTAVGALNAAGLPNLAGYPWLIAVLFVLGAPALAAVATGLLALIRGEAFDSGPRRCFPIMVAARRGARALDRVSLEPHE